MIKLNQSVAFLLILTSLMVSIPAGTQQKAAPYWITGRAVDGKGRPVVGAKVLINYPPCKGCIDQLLPSALTQENGAFALSAEELPAKELKLYIEGPVPEGFYSPLSPPFDVLRHNPKFSGYSLPVKSGVWKDDIGNVPVKILYAGVKIDLVSVFEGKYQADVAEARNIVFNLKDGCGKEVYSGSLPEAMAFDPTFTFARIALPKGRWTLLFTLNDQHKMVMSRRLFVRTNNSGCTTVTFRKGRQHLSGCSRFDK
ncbi:MAG: carboxypeptidase-like regulatory domain-containing protein [Blastocatellia bacterium]